MTPERAAADAASRVRFAGLGRDAALVLAEQDFKLARPAWTAPGSEGGERLRGYLGEHGAVEQLPDGHRAVVSSTVPLRVDDGSGLAPVSLSLSDDGEAFVPVNPLVPIAISKRAAGGIAFPAGLSVAPLSAATPQAPVVAGDSVLYANVAKDTDLIAEPRTNGAEISWQLRSQDSPSEQSLAFNLPAGGALRPSATVRGGVEVQLEGRTLLLVSPAVAEGADGASVPTSYSIAGNVLTTHVDLSGHVDFPVLVDPNLFYGYYGAKNGANVWSGWGHGNNCSCFGFQEYANLIQTGTNPGAPTGAYGAWWVYAPGPAGKSGSAGITRVDVTGATHQASGQSTLVATINESNGPAPVYSYNGTAGASGPLPLYEQGNLQGQSIAFCASGGGGHDGGEQPLCDEQNYQGRSFLFEDEINAAQTVFNYVQMEGAQVTYRDPAAPNKVVLNHPGYEGQWLKTAPTNWTIEAEDEGLGLAHLELQIPAGASPTFKQDINCNAQNGFTGCPNTYSSEAINLSGVNKTGELSLAPVALDAAENAARPSGSYVPLFLDQTPPEIGTLSGPLAQAGGKVVGDGLYSLGFAPVDGSKASPQSGVRTVEVKVDGQHAYTQTSTCSAPKGVPAEGCFGLSGSWTFNGELYGAGTHVVSVVARDWVGNEASKSIVVTVNEAGYQSLGPGAVNLQTGDFRLNPTDVSLSGANATLSVSRAYDSRKPTQGVGGPLGAQWTLSLPDGTAGEWRSLTVLAEGVSVSDAHGRQLVFSPKAGGGFVSPPGYQTDTLSELSSTRYQLVDATGDVTTFTQPTGGGPLVPSSVVEASAAGELNKVSYQFTTTAQGVTEPTEVIAPEPGEGVGPCTSSLVKGCRALTFNYAESTTASGEGSSEWGDYKGQLSRVYFTAWDPSKGAMTTTTVAQYAYDTRGRLRSEWDPRVSPALKVDYGYTGEGLVSAVSAPGQETWAMTYGTIAGDASPGRVLKATQAPASAALWGGGAPANTEAPVISGSPIVGVRMAVSSGRWSAGPVTYAYQWEDCNAEGGGQCSQIAGAENANYTPTSSDVGHTLVALLSATNGGGSVVKASGASAVVQSSGTPTQGEVRPPAPGSTVEYRVALTGTGAPYAMGAKEVEAWAQSAAPAEATAIFPPDEPQGWPASDYRRASVFYIDGANQTVDLATPGGAISTTEYDSYDNVRRTLSADNRQRALEAGARSVEEARLLDSERTYSADGTELVETLGPQHAVKLTNGNQILSRRYGAYYYDEGEPAGGPYRLLTKSVEGSLIAGQNVEEKRTVTNSYAGQGNLGWKLHKPTSVTTSESSGQTLTTSTSYAPLTGDVTETTSAAGVGQDTKVGPAFSGQFGKPGSEAGQLKEPRAAVIAANGNVQVLDSGNSRVEEYSPAGAYVGSFGSPGSGNGMLKTPFAMTLAPKSASLLIADTANNRIEVFNGKDEYQSQYGGEGTAGGQFKEPKAIAVSPTSGNIFVADTANNRVEELTETGTFKAAFGFGVSDGKNEREICEKQCRAGIAGVGSGQFTAPRGVAVSAEGKVWVADTANNRLEEFLEDGQWKATAGTHGSGPAQFSEPTALSFDAAGNLYVSDAANDRFQKLSSSETFIAAAGSKGTSTGQFEEPGGLAVASSGEIYSTDVKDSRIETWQPGMIGNNATHTTLTSYYVAGTNSFVPACRSHPEWAGEPCQAGPAAQPEHGLPNLPVTSYTYNIWDEPATSTDTVASNVRTTTVGYDAAGRILTSAITSSADTPMPSVTDEYSPETGALVKQSTTSEGKTKSIKSEFNKLGQLTAYTDAGENTSTYEYEPEGDYRLVKVNDGKGTQTYGYDATTGLLSSLEDSQAGTFTATRDLEGNLATQSYPNAMTATYTRNQAGEAVGVEYVKSSHCAKSCPEVWYSDSVTPSIHGQWAAQTSTLSKQTYAYSENGWLTEVQDTPAGEGCTTRSYAYEEDGNRTLLSTRAPGAEGKCASEGAGTQSFAYDSADRLQEEGVSYDAFGNTTTLPAQDAGGSPLTSTYYADDTLASEEQNGQSVSYTLDPAGRTLETISKGPIKSTVTSHYAAPGDSPAWSGTASTWTRNITGIDGNLVATRQYGKTPVLQLANLHGDIIATAALSESETKLLSTSESTEFGVPRSGSPSKYSWLGAYQRPTELSSGVVDMGARAYIPQLGRFEQTDPQPGGSANAYAYTDDDPVNQLDLSGEWSSSISYDYEAARSGSGQQGLPEQFSGPGAVAAPPVSMQIEEEFDANPPWLAAAAFDAERTVSFDADFATKRIGGGSNRHGFITYSGDGCGDGGYCGGKWVRPTEKGHVHGEPIGESHDPKGALTCFAVAGAMIATGVDSWMGAVVGFGCSLATS